MSRNKGISMIEVLITMFVVAVALLGTASLQAHALKVNHGSQFRGQAVLLGMDILERIESNNDGAVAGNYAATLPGNTAAPACATLPCTAAQMATFDLVQVEQALRQLPEATATVTFAGAGPYTYTVQINWTERASRKAAGGGTPATEAFSYTVSRTVYDKSPL